MAKNALDALLALPASERLRFSQVLWESVDDKSPCSLTNDERLMLDQRLAADDAEPEDRIPWAQARAEIQSALDKL